MTQYALEARDRRWAFDGDDSQGHIIKSKCLTDPPNIS